MIRTYRYKMRPTERQKEFLSKCFGCSRYVYNYALSLKTEAYRTEKKSLSFFDLCAAVRELKEQPDHAWLKEVPALSLNYALLNLSNAYSHFFKTKSGFPKYKSKKRSRDSVKWWKEKVIFTRPLTSDDAKAWRMIKNALKGKKV